jgi:hypothetical protein
VVTRDDVPYCFRPSFFGAWLLLAACVYIALLVVAPEVRPSIVNAFLGIGLGWIAYRLFRPLWVQYLREITEACHKDPDVRYWACIANGPRYTKNNALYFGVELAVVLGGFMIAASSSLLLVMIVAPGPVAAQIALSEGAFVPGMMSTLLVYAGTIVLFVFCRTRRWYAELGRRDNDSTPSSVV